MPSLIDGSAICIRDASIHQDVVWEELIQPGSSDAATVEVYSCYCVHFLLQRKDCSLITCLVVFIMM